MTIFTSTMNRHALGAAFATLLALAAGTFPMPAAQAADGYYPMICRGPLPVVTAMNGTMRLRARPGRRANAPRPGECVWLDRGVNRRGEVGRDGFMRISLRAPGLRVRVLNVNGRIRQVIVGNRLARGIWQSNNLGRAFIFEARRVGNRGGYVARQMREPVRATPAPSTRRGATVTAEPAPRRPVVRVRPAP